MNRDRRRFVPSARGAARLLAALLGIAAAAALGGCSDEYYITGWQLVGVYDAAAVAALARDPEVAEEEGPSYVWVPSGGMAESCGPAKAPDGMGVFEAEAIANELSPTLAVVLERTEGMPHISLRPQDVRVAIGHERPQVLLQPAVVPRYIAVQIEGPGPLHYKQLVRTQLQMELCMEHKTGRGWVGGEAGNLRQAFLLDPPDQPNWGADRRYFGGQRDPIPPLLGPPDACIAGDTEASIDAGGAGAGSLDLVPSDIWGASLRACGVEETPGMRVVGAAKDVPLRLGDGSDVPSRRPAATWDGLKVVVGPGEADEEVEVDVVWRERGEDPTLLLDRHPLFSQPPAVDGSLETRMAGMTDLLARVPHRYPTLGTREDPDRYALLLVPNWQLVEALRRLDADPEDPMRPRPTAGRGVQYGVGWVLEHPEMLFVQVPPTDGSVTLEDGDEGEAWLDLSETVSGGGWGMRDWGYAVGTLAGRKPIAIPGSKMPTWDQTRAAQRAPQQGVFIAAVALLAVLVITGLRRARDLWTKIPEERVDYWPGLPANAQGQAGAGAKAPKGASGGGGGGGGGGAAK